MVAENIFSVEGFLQFTCISILELQLPFLHMNKVNPLNEFLVVGHFQANLNSHPCSCGKFIEVLEERHYSVVYSECL